jgi:hypothetical protein
MLNGNTLEDFLQTSKEVDEYDNLDCRILAADSIRQLVYFVRQQQAEIEALKKNLDVALMIVNEPAKTLTDEEIMQIVEESYMPQGMDKSRYTGFARAILKKANEK